MNFSEEWPLAMRCCPSSRRWPSTGGNKSSKGHSSEKFIAVQFSRNEFLGGVALSYAMLPELKAMAEYRRQQIIYDTQGQVKDKQSDFLLVGADYVVNA